MKNHRQVFFLVIFIGFGGHASASSGGYSTPGEIIGLYFGSGGDYVRIDMTVSDSTTYCNTSGQSYTLEYDPTSELTKEFYKIRVSAILAAYAAKKKVRFYLTHNNCTPSGNPKIQGLEVMDSIN